MALPIKRKDFVNFNKAVFHAVFSLGRHPDLNFAVDARTINRRIAALVVESLDHEMPFNIADAIEDSIDQWIEEQAPVGQAPANYAQVSS